ncbi:exoribonuclease [Staphylococcus gallinarum]|uniref:Exoribonuclease n=1 Tax=Staphylococcus gallinarum TaxID=1293 RepID=A0A380FCX3_STAGA|nr:exoribonuclease [Staphylococcus gallinarum]
MKHEIFDSVIHSNYRMTYDEVNEIITDQKCSYTQSLCRSYTNARSRNKIYQIDLINMRRRRGEIDFDINEAKVIS